MVVVGGQQRVVVEVVLGGHGQLGLQQHRVEAGRASVSRSSAGATVASLVGEQLAQVLLVEARVEQVGVRVAGRRLRWANGDVRTLTLR